MSAQLKANLVRHQPDSGYAPAIEVPRCRFLGSGVVLEMKEKSKP
jgi:hypothetical protein